MLLTSTPLIKGVWVSVIVKPRRPRHVNNFRPHFRTIFLSSGELCSYVFVTSFDNPSAAYGSLFVFSLFWGVIFVSWGKRSGVALG